MVTMRGSRRGASTLGCLVSLILFLGTMYYGSKIGAIYWRLYSLRDAMKVEARFANNQTDDAIRRKLVLSVDEIGLPPEAKRFRIRRLSQPRRIIIETRYEEGLDLPFVESRTLVFTPRIENRY